MNQSIAISVLGPAVWLLLANLAGVGWRSNRLFLIDQRTEATRAHNWR